MAKRTLLVEVTYEARKVDAEYVVNEIEAITGVIKVREKDQGGEDK